MYASIDINHAHRYLLGVPQTQQAGYHAASGVETIICLSFQIVTAPMQDHAEVDDVCCSAPPTKGNVKSPYCSRVEFKDKTYTIQIIYVRTLFNRNIREIKLKRHGPECAHAHRMPPSTPRKPSLWLPAAVLQLISPLKLCLRNQAIWIDNAD